MSETLSRKEYIKYCQNCPNKSFDNNIGLICGLTNKESSFSTNCHHYKPKEDGFDEVKNEIHHLKIIQKRKKIIGVGVIISVLVVIGVYFSYQFKLKTINIQSDLSEQEINSLKMEDIRMQYITMILHWSMTTKI